MVRGGVTLALGVYLVGLVLSIAANSSSGASALVSTIHGRLFSPWLAPPWLDLGFDIPLTRGLPEDADHRLDVKPWSRSAPPLALPAAGARGERAARWRRLARAVAIDDADPDGTGALATGLAAGLFSRTGADDVALDVVRTRLPDRAEADAAPGRETVVSFRLRRAGGGIQLIRASDAEELAPLVRPAGSAAGEAR